MRFTCEKSQLLQGLNIAGRTVAQKSALSALEGVLCKAGSGLTLTGYNMETAITYQIAADVVEDGECVFPKLFSDIIRRLPEGPVTVVVDEQYHVSIRSGYSSFTISAEAADEYPDLPDVSTGHPIRIPQNQLKNLINGTIFAVADNQARPIHNGVKFEVSYTAITAVAVDGFRLARRTFHPAESTERELSFVVRRQRQMCIRDRPTDCPIKLIASVHDLASSVERVGLIVSEKYKSPIRCVFGNQELQMRTSTTIGSAEDRCSYAGDGQELEIGFNVRYMADALRAIPTEEVTMELTNGLSPIVLTPVDDKNDFAYMILPVRIKN